MRKFKKRQLNEAYDFLESTGLTLAERTKKENKVFLPKYAIRFLESKENGNFYKSPIYKIQNTEYHIEGVGVDYYVVRTLLKDDNAQRRVLLSTEQLEEIKDLSDIKEKEVKSIVGKINRSGGFGL